MKMLSVQQEKRTIPIMSGGRKPSSSTQIRDGILARTRAARLMSGLSQQEVIDQLHKRTGHRVKLATYKKWETRTPIPHHLVIAFCETTGSDPWLLLTGSPFRLGRTPPPTPPINEKTGT